MKNQVLYLCLLFVLSGMRVSGQMDSRNANTHIIFAELGGMGGFGSLNYEHIFLSGLSFKMSARIGLSTYRLTDYTGSFNPDVFLPMGINTYLGNKHMLVLGLGQVLTSTVEADHSELEPVRRIAVHGSLSVGYQFQKHQSGIAYRVLYTPLFENYSSCKTWFAAAIAYIF